MARMHDTGDIFYTTQVKKFLDIAKKAWFQIYGF